MKAIETVYKGYRFRSRLEARWAVFMDAFGIKWEYEKEGYDLGYHGWYLPDFFVSSENFSGHAGGGVWFEIKGRTPSNAELAKLSGLAKQTNCHARMLIGEPGENMRVACADRLERNGRPVVKTASEYCYRNDGRHPDWRDAFGDLFHDTDSTMNHPVDMAIEAMRSARFEHGEAPTFILRHA